MSDRLDDHAHDVRAHDPVRARRPRRRRLRALLAGLLVLALAGAVATTVALRHRAAQDREEQQARSFATQVAVALSRGSVPQGVTAADGTVPDLRPVLEGMGPIRHEVRVSAFTRAEDSATATLTHRWFVHADKAPWQYDTTLSLTRRAGRWTTTYAPDPARPRPARRRGAAGGAARRAARRHPR